MKTYFFILFIVPVAMLAQQQAPPANGSTDCPTFGKKNNYSKAGLFRSMRTNKSQKTAPQLVYRTGAPSIPIPENTEEAIALRQEKRAEREAKRAVIKKQRPPKNAAVPASEPVASVPAIPDEPSATPLPDKPEIEPSTEITDNHAEEADGLIDENESVDREARDKKVRKAAVKGKMKRLFKKHKMPSSRKNVQKCPQF